MADALESVFEAAEDGDLELATRLLNANPALLRSRNELNDQPLHVACMQKHAALVELFLNRGADVNAPGDNGKTPLHYAVYQGDQASTPIVKLLLAAGADVNVKDATLEQNSLGWAVREANEGLAEAIELLILAGANADLEVAVARNDLPLARQILSGDPGMSIARIRVIADIGRYYGTFQVPAELSAFWPHLQFDRTEIVAFIDEWLSSKEQR